MTEEELEALVDRIRDDFIGEQRDPQALTTLCAIELFDSLKAAVVRGEPPRRYSRRELREATFDRSRKAHPPGYHVDTQSFTKTPEQVAARLARRKGMFEDPITGLRLTVVGPTYEARGRTGDPQKYYFVISGLDDVPRHQMPRRLPALGTPVIVLHVERERSVAVPDEPLLKAIGLTVEEFVKDKAHDSVLFARNHAAGQLDARIEIERESCFIEKTDESTYRARALAELRFPTSLGVSVLPSFLGVHAATIDAYRVEIRYAPEDPVGVWRAALEIMNELDPQPIPIYDDLTPMFENIDLYCTKVWGAGPGSTRYTVSIQNLQAIIVTLGADDARGLGDAMRGFPLRTFLNKQLGLAADF